MNWGPKDQKYYQHTRLNTISTSESIPSFQYSQNNKKDRKKKKTPTVGPCPSRAFRIL